MKTKAELRTENAILKEQLNACAATLTAYYEADALKNGTTPQYQKQYRASVIDIGKLAQPRIPRTTNG